MTNFTDFSDQIMKLRYSQDGKETWNDIAERVVNSVFSVVKLPKDIIDETKQIIKQRKFIPGGRFLAQAGKDYHMINNCYMIRAGDSREGWGKVLHDAAIISMTGGGVGITYSNIRASGSKLHRTGGNASGPLPLIDSVNGVARGVMAGGHRRSAIGAWLSWEHDDIVNFINSKDWSDDIINIKKINPDFPAPLDMTNISVILDKNFFDAFENSDNSNHNKAKYIYWLIMEKMLITGEPGIHINYNNNSEDLRNPCGEIVSEDNLDVCCLGSINLARISTLDELKYITQLGQIFLLAGTQYSDIPIEEARITRENNRRTGLGLLGLHEWLLTRNKKYERDEELSEWLKIWKLKSKETSDNFCDLWSWKRSKANRAIAPNGTISIAGGQTTPGIEPIFSVAYKRTYLTPNGRKSQFVIDPVAEKLIKSGISPDKIEDAYSLSIDIEKRIDFQSFIQQYVDNAISITNNLPKFGNVGNDDIKKFGKILYKYLPNLRGITCFPDGSRGSQPLEVIDYNYAMKHKNKVFEANENNCAGGICGI